MLTHLLKGLLRLKFKLLRLLNAGEPSKEEVRYALVQYLHTLEITKTLVLYVVCGVSLEQIAQFQDITQECVKQRIREACRKIEDQ